MIAERISGWHWEPMVEMRICWNRWNLCKMRRYIGDVISKWNNVGERMNVSGGDNGNRCNSKYLYRISIKSIIFYYLCVGCRIDNLVLVAFRLLFRKVKRPKFNEQTDNRHIKCSRHLAWVCLCLYGYLVVPSLR